MLFCQLKSQWRCRRICIISPQKTLSEAKAFKRNGATVKQKIKLDPLEKEIEAHVDKFVPITGEKRRRVEAIIERGRKTKNINIRITEDDLAHLKQKAEEEGMPYQTLISSVLHKYVTDRLVDEKEILKSLHLMGKY